MKSVNSPQGIWSNPRRSASSNVWGISPISGTDQPSPTPTAVATMMPSSDDGKRAFQRAGQNTIVRMTSVPSATACQSTTKPPRK